MDSNRQRFHPALLLFLAGCAAAPVKPTTVVDLFGSHSVTDAEALSIAGLAAEMPGERPDAVEVKKRLLASGRFSVVAPFEWDAGQRHFLFIDLLDKDAPAPPAVRAVPTGSVPLPDEVVALNSEFEATFLKEIESSTQGEDWVEGRLLRRFPPMRALELRYLALGRAHQPALERAAVEDADPLRRRAAIMALGYAGDFAHAAPALIEAIRDPDSDARQDASRQLERLLRQQRCADPSFTLPAEPFFQQLKQPHVLERQKAASILFELARTDAEVGRRLREEVWPWAQALGRARLHIARRAMLYRVGSYQRDPPLTYDELGAWIERDHPEDAPWWRSMSNLKGRRLSWENPCAGYPGAK